MRYVATYADEQHLASSNERGHVICAAIEIYTAKLFEVAPIFVIDTKAGEIVFKIGPS